MDLLDFAVGCFIHFLSRRGLFCTLCAQWRAMKRKQTYIAGDLPKRRGLYSNI